MSRQEGNGDAGLAAVIRQMQKASAVLACIRFTAEHDNEIGADLADAIAVVLAIITAAAINIDEAASASGKEAATA